MAGWDMFIQKNVSELHQKELGDATWGSRFRVLLANQPMDFAERNIHILGGRTCVPLTHPWIGLRTISRKLWFFP
jgi:hypothetical protein